MRASQVLGEETLAPLVTSADMVLGPRIYSRSILMAAVKWKEQPRRVVQGQGAELRSETISHLVNLTVCVRPRVSHNLSRNLKGAVVTTGGGKCFGQLREVLIHGVELSA